MAVRRLTREELAARDLANAQRREPRVLSLQYDGDFATIEFTNDDGEQVVSVYTMRSTTWTRHREEWRQRRHEALRNGKDVEMTFIGNLNGPQRDES